jgi:hypothetical protein
MTACTMAVHASRARTRRVAGRRGRPLASRFPTNSARSEEAPRVDVGISLA